jgi:hypothetical protein
MGESGGNPSGRISQRTKASSKADSTTASGNRLIQQAVRESVIVRPGPQRRIGHVEV